MIPGEYDTYALKKSVSHQRGDGNFSESKQHLVEILNINAFTDMVDYFNASLLNKSIIKKYKSIQIN